MQSIQDRLKAAIEAGIIARGDYYKIIELDNEQQLGEPTPIEKVLQLEANINQTLPPSYREFLLLHNGWIEVDGGVDLLPIEELLKEQDQYDIQQWQRNLQDEGEETLANCLVIGASNVTATKYLLNPEVIDENGEWQFLQHHHEIEAELSSFIQWLEESVEEYRELLEMEQADADE